MRTNCSDHETVKRQLVMNKDTLLKVRQRTSSSRFGRKKGVIVPMLLTAAGAAGSLLLTTDDESNKGL